MDIVVAADGHLSWDGQRVRCALGRGGLRTDKREGDGATPIGSFALRRIFYRADRLPPPATGLPVQPLALLHAIGEMLPRDAVVIEEALSSAPGIRQLIRSDDPQSYFGLRGGGIGWGLPATIGVKLALPDRPVIGLIGDGSAMYTCQALWTAARYRIDCVFVILNNSSYRILKQRLHAMRGLAEQADSYVGMELLDPKIDFVGLARSLGIKAERAKTVHEATDLVAQGLKGGGALLIDVELDRAFKPI